MTEKKTMFKESGVESTQGRNWKDKKLSKNIPMDNITELNELIYAKA